MNCRRGIVTKFVNCKVLRKGEIIDDYLYVRDGKIIDPEKLFFDEKRMVDQIYDCKGCTIAPGFIELQINGGFGYDFSFCDDVEVAINVVAKGLLAHGVTSFCPTIVTSPKEIYHKILPKLVKRKGGQNGAAVLGVHCEGPFINPEKKGAHPIECIRSFENGGIRDLEDVYGSLDNIKIITLAPEIKGSAELIRQLTERNIIVSIGHSEANLTEGEAAFKSGASFITHLFNAMLPFHHRDPGLVGLLASQKLPKDKIVYFGIISDCVHTHPATLRIAYKANPQGLVVVTDAISALGLKEGKHRIGQLEIEIRNNKAYIAHTDTLCGSIANTNEAVKLLIKSTGCSVAYALEAASLHPARVLGIEHSKGTLNYGADADFILLDNDLQVVSTWIAGERVYKKCSATSGIESLNN